MRNKLLYIVSFFLFIVDAITKLVVNSSLKYSKAVTIINNFFYISYVKNTGGAFGILEGNVFLIIIVTMLIFIFIIKYIKNNKLDILQLWGYGLIIGGAIGNLFDRVIYGYVIDFFDFHIFGFNFPVFNIADCGIVVGGLLIVFQGIKDESGGKVDSNGKKLYKD